MVSEQPEFSVEGLRQDEAGWLRQEYAQLPDDWADLHALTGAVTASAETDFDKAAAIAAYLHSLRYDETTGTPLSPAGPLRDFVTGEAGGSAMDFATAAALMARSAGFQSRVVTGYLPGKYNAYSGASTVTQEDAHAWAEVWFRETGWVPFDPSSRPDIPVPSDMGEAPATGFGYLLEHRVGDQLASAAGKAPTSLMSGISAIARYWVIAVSVTSLLVAAVSAWWLIRRRSKRARQVKFIYSRIQGDDRKRVLRLFAVRERSLARDGFRRRSKDESFMDYARAVSERELAGEHGLGPLAALASRAAYSEEPLTKPAVSPGSRPADDIDALPRWHEAEQKAA